MKPLPPPDGSLLDARQRSVLSTLVKSLTDKNFRQAEIRPQVSELVNTLIPTCATDDDIQQWSDEMERWVRWYRLPAYWLTFLLQEATVRSGSILHLLACLRYSEAQVSLADDMGLNSVETAYGNVQRNRDVLGKLYENVETPLRRYLREYHSYYSTWCRPFAYVECNPLADHLYSKVTMGVLADNFPDFKEPFQESNYLAIAGQCRSPDTLYYGIVARRFLGSHYSAQGRLGEAVEQFQLGLKDALKMKLDTEIGHLRRLLGLALRSLGQLAEARHQFEQACIHERSEYFAYWRALSARELGETLVLLSGRATPADQKQDFRVEIGDPALLEPALNAYHEGRLFFAGHLGEQSPYPITRAVKQQMFRSFAGNAAQICAMSRKWLDLLAEIETNGPRQATEVVAEISAANQVAPTSLAEYRRLRAGAFTSLNTFPQSFEDYLGSFSEEYAARKAYIRSWIPISSHLARAQIGDFVAKAVLEARIPNTVLLLFEVGQTQSLAVLVDSGAGQVECLPAGFNEQTIRSIHDEYTRNLQKREGEVPKEAVERLLTRYEDLIGPLLEPLVPFLKGRRLKILPRLQMNAVPLHALRLGSHYLIEHCEVSYCQTLALFLQVHSRVKKATGGRCTIVVSDGLPFYDGMLRAPVFRDASRLRNEPWSKIADYLRESPPRDLLFACHGKFMPEKPQISQLSVGAGQNVKFSDVFADLDLGACRSVMMGACESGLARSEISAEYIGLPSALLSSGVQYVLGALWQVDQLATALLAEQYFEMVTDEKVTVPGALKEAQTSLMKMERDAVSDWVRERITPVRPDLTPALLGQIGKMEVRPFAHPAYWAGMQAVGDV